MIILGINDMTPHNTSAALLRDGEVIAAIEEERLSRIKLDAAYPHQAIAKVMADAGVSVEDIDQVAFAGLSRWQQRQPLNLMFDRIRTLARDDQPIRKFYRKQQFSRYSRLLKQRTNPPGVLGEKPSITVEHHKAHAASAYYCSPFADERVAVISYDGSGDFSCASVWLGEQGEMHYVDYLHAINSVGLLYSAVTVFLGFKHTRHEGKVLGLAAFGDPEPFFSRLMALVNLDNWDQLFSAKLARVTLRQFSEMGQSVLQELAGDLCKEDVAAGIQAFTEHLICQWVQKILQKIEVHHLALAGGLFANVKLNQRLMALPEVDNIYVHPNMGDGGLATGAALVAWAEHSQEKPRFLSHVYLGHCITEEEAKQALDAANLTYTKPEQLAQEVGALLANGKVVARAAGGMEYGPRALGNRTVMAPCHDPEINQWLNKKFQRTEFMPFAPVVLEEAAASFFPDWHPDHVTCRFMTMTCDASELAKKQIPAAVHVDGTARPQVLRREDNPDYYDIIAAYAALAGIPSVINTSFNMHEEPIVCSAADAVRAFLDAQLDALILGPFLIELPKSS
ncbi:MAG: carbamoyltransferase N-terminal domain-containing protein [Mariprofundaceae bacterium]|nr:carbamoyltransferase N-terminal domain-containing protein [Mariprofundaceae bacterium]